MVFDGVGTVMQKAQAIGARVHFADGVKAELYPRLKVFRITAPSGHTCSLKSVEGAPYLASLCQDASVGQTFERELDLRLTETLGPPVPHPPRPLPVIKEVHLVDRYL
ncbi:MAG: hypothetical protein KQJ78_05375 [Deltaproteobacteria bacterium]|nr:hypothetical protein [Deltaproteobacteria bacterium]